MAPPWLPAAAGSPSLARALTPPLRIFQASGKENCESLATPELTALKQRVKPELRSDPDKCVPYQTGAW